jgi:hypothetical protein
MPTKCNRCFLLQILLLAQHVSCTIMPIIRSSGVLYRWLLSVVFGALVFKSSVWCGAEGCVSGFRAAASIVYVSANVPYSAECYVDVWAIIKLNKNSLLLIPTRVWLIPSRNSIIIRLLINKLHQEIKTILRKGNENKGNSFILTSLFLIILANNFLGLFPYIFTKNIGLVNQK